MQTNPFGELKEIKFKVVTGNTDATSNIILSGMTRLNSYVLGASGTMDGTGDIKHLIGGIPMVEGGGTWFIHVVDYAGNPRATENVSLKIAYVDL